MYSTEAPGLGDSEAQVTDIEVGESIQAKVHLFWGVDCTVGSREETGGLATFYYRRSEREGEKRKEEERRGEKRREGKRMG